MCRLPYLERKKTGQNQRLSAIAVFGRPKGDGHPEKIPANFSVKNQNIKEKHHDPKN